MKFGAKKSHEMISYNLSWIASSGEWEYGMSTKPFYLAKMTLIEFYNKSHALLESRIFVCVWMELRQVDGGEMEG